MKDRVIYKKKMQEFGFDNQDDFFIGDEEPTMGLYSGVDVDKIKTSLQRSFIRRRISSQKAEILVGSIFSIIEKMVEVGFNSRAMMILDKAVGFINKRLG